MNSDQIIESLQPYGIVDIFQSEDKTFSAKAKLFMHGMVAEVFSGYRHATMLAALTTLQSKVFELIEHNSGMKQIGKQEDGDE